MAIAHSGEYNSYVVSESISLFKYTDHVLGQKYDRANNWYLGTQGT